MFYNVFAKIRPDSYRGCSLGSVGKRYFLKIFVFTMSLFWLKTLTR